MSIGILTVIDATSSRTKDLNTYKKLSDQYGYEIIIVDFADVPLETCLAQNRKRATYKWVPDDVIKNIYTRFATQQIPEGVRVINKNDTIGKIDS